MPTDVCGHRQELGDIVSFGAKPALGATEQAAPSGFDLPGYRAQVCARDRHHGEGARVCVHPLRATAEKEVDTLKPYHHEPQLFESSSVSLTKGPKVMFPITVEYSPLDRVELVLEAIERTIVSAAEMEQHIAAVIGSGIHNWSGVTFHSDDPNAVPVALDLRTIHSRIDNGHHLTKLLRDLRNELAK